MGCARFAVAEGSFHLPDCGDDAVCFVEHVSLLVGDAPYMVVQSFGEGGKELKGDTNTGQYQSSRKKATRVARQSAGDAHLFFTMFAVMIRDTNFVEQAVQLADDGVNLL